MFKNLPFAKWCLFIEIFLLKKFGVKKLQYQLQFQFWLNSDALKYV